MEWKPKNFAGTYISDRDLEKIPTEKWEISPEYRYDTGKAIGRFLQGLKEKKILGVKCPKCQRVLLPPRDFCELCFVKTIEWVELEPRGKVKTFSLCYMTWDVRKLDEPEIPAVIEVCGASDGMGIMGLLGEVKPEDVKIGIEVEAVFAKERKGRITDIAYWRPRGR